MLTERLWSTWLPALLTLRSESPEGERWTDHMPGAALAAKIVVLLAGFAILTAALSLTVFPLIEPLVFGVQTVGG